MIKTKFVFAVSLVAMLAVSSAWANDPADTSSTTDTVATEHTVYTNQTPTSGTGIAGVSYVNKAVNNAGASAQAAEAHAAAAGQSALNAASSAAAAAASAQSANEALENKQDKSTAVKVTKSGIAVGSATVPVYVNSSGVATEITSYSGNAASATKATQDGNGKVIADTYATKAELKILGDDQSGLVTDVNELKTGKQDVLGYTAENSANKVTSVSSTSTDTQYPSAKAMYTALSGKQATISDLATIRSGAAAGATAVQDLGDLGVTATATELNYVDGVTSNIQTQLNAKQASLGYTAENVANKVTSVSSTSTDTQYPSAKAMYTALNNKLDKTAKAASATTADSATKATQDGNGKVIADTYATKALVDSLGNTQSGLVTSVNELTTGKQAISTAEYQMGNASGGWTAMTTAQQNALNSGVTSTTKVTHTASTAAGTTTRPVYVTSGGVATAVTGMSIPVGAATATSTTEWATIWVE